MQATALHQLPCVSALHHVHAARRRAQGAQCSATASATDLASSLQQIEPQLVSTCRPLQRDKELKLPGCVLSTRN